MKKLIDAAYSRTKELLNGHKDELHLLASRLLEREVIYKEDLEQIFGKRKWEDKSEMAHLVHANGAGVNETIPTIILPPAGENPAPIEST